MLEELKNILSDIFHFEDEKFLKDKKFYFTVEMDSPEQAQEMLVEILRIKHPNISCEIYIDKKDPKIVLITIFSFIDNDIRSLKTLVETILKKGKEINYGKSNREG